MYSRVAIEALAEAEANTKVKNFDFKPAEVRARVNKITCLIHDILKYLIEPRKRLFKIVGYQ